MNEWSILGQQHNGVFRYLCWLFLRLPISIPPPHISPLVLTFIAGLIAHSNPNFVFDWHSGHWAGWGCHTWIVASRCSIQRTSRTNTEAGNPEGRLLAEMSEALGSRRVAGGWNRGRMGCFAEGRAEKQDDLAQERGRLGRAGLHHILSSFPGQITLHRAAWTWHQQISWHRSEFSHW